jgi:hypothetical protein
MTTKKSESKKTKKSGEVLPRTAKKDASEPKIDPRKKLLARVAGDVASGVVGSPSESTPNAEAVAAIAVDVAEEILKKVGL